MRYYLKSIIKYTAGAGGRNDFLVFFFLCASINLSILCTFFSRDGQVPYIFIYLFIHIILFFCILIGTSNAARIHSVLRGLFFISSLLFISQIILLVNNSDYIFRRCVLHCKSLFYYLMFNICIYIIYLFSRIPLQRRC